MRRLEGWRMGFGRRCGGGVRVGSVRSAMRDIWKRAVVLAGLLVLLTAVPGCVITDLKDGVVSANENLAESNALLASIDAHLASIDDQMESLEGRLTSVDEQLSGTKVQLDAIEEHLTSFRKTINKIDGMLPFVKISGDDARDEAELEEDPDGG